MSLMDGARRAVNECMGVQKGEKVLVLTDTEKEPIGRAIFAAADEAGADPFLTVMKPRSRHGEEPPEAIAAIMRATDVVIAPTAKSVSHTQARRKACEAGVRVATMPGINEFIMEKGAMTADFRAIAARIAKVGVFLEGSKKARVTTALGTDITFGLEGRRWVLDDTGICHKKGGFTNLPAGEVFIAPLEGTTSGTLVVDGAMPETLDRPIRLTFEKGTVTKIEGGSGAEKLRAILEAAAGKLADPKAAYNTAELGVGMNPQATLIGNVLQDEKALGTIHVAIGDNSTIGGTVRAGVHIDGIITKPTVLIDGKTLLRDGSLVV